MKTEIIKITDTAYGGSGVGRNAEGKAVFVPFTVTGDIVLAEIVEDKGSYDTAELVDVMEPSPWRRPPHCPHHGICGGCHFGHIAYDKQVEIKKNILKQALRKHPQAEKLPEFAIFTDKTTEYRIRATVRAQSGRAGFYKGGSNEFIPVECCPVMKPGLFAKCAVWAEGHADSGLYSLSAIENPEGDTITLIEGKGTLPQIDSEKPFSGVKCGVKQFGKQCLLYGTPFGAIPVGYGGFFQANVFLNDMFQKYASDAVTGHKVLELYAGSGFFTSALMQNADVTAVEANAAAASLGMEHSYPVRQGDAASVNIKKGGYDTVFVDPPREGVDKKTIAAISEASPAQIIYVSCNPMTLARDLNKLSDKYTISDAAIFDLFPHTYHIETIISMRRTGT